MAVSAYTDAQLNNNISRNVKQYSDLDLFFSKNSIIFALYAIQFFTTKWGLFMKWLSDARLKIESTTSQGGL